jgi:hypothetical protein
LQELALPPDAAVTLLPDLFPAAHRAGEGTLLRVWLLARAVTPETYRIPQGTLLAAMQTHLGMQARQAKNLLAQGNQLWWRVDPKSAFVYLIGAKAVASRLQVTASDAPAVKLPFAKLAKLQTFYAACYAAYMQRYVRGLVAKPVSRAQLLTIFGVTRNTLRVWEKQAGVVVLANFAFARPTDFHVLPDRPFEYHCNCGFIANSALVFAPHHTTCKESYVIVWDRPNSYLPPTVPTTGTASPIGPTRLTLYQKRHTDNPTETTRPESPVSSACASRTSPARMTSGWLCPGSRTLYRPGKCSDPLPPVLVNIGVPLCRLWRARNA